ncbi:unnamed protein product [Diabrotica balteata]|uniref:Uncharacterized protein n=1 Tax=Diabrotica balteata TaxID=107213 RepID=A0A9N9XE04_DIABA|nr:unnamed protein product [Diabrotica balteata]
MMLVDYERVRLDEFLESCKNTIIIGGAPTSYAEHRINTENSVPSALPPYRMSPAKREVLKAELDKLLEEGTIEKCVGVTVLDLPALTDVI